MLRALPLLALLLLPPLALADAASAAAPAYVIALDADAARALVAWAPGDAPADAYRVYGVSAGGGFTLLAEAPSLAVDGFAQLVDGGYATYAVTGVVAGQESAPTWAGADGGCITYEDDPWAVSVSTECIDGVRRRVEGILRP